MQSTQILRFSPKLLAASVALALAACASTPMPNAQLDQAHAAYLRTSADPVTARVAARELQQANEALGRADAAYKAEEPTDQVNHLAYLAKQRVAVAEETGRIAQADASAADAKAQRERIVLQSRTREAQSAQQLAAQREADAKAARQQADASQDKAQMLAQQTQMLQQQLKDLKARQTDRGMVLTLGDVLFDTGAATLKPGAMRTVDQLASFLSQHPENKVLIEGYTDSVGSDSTNLELSQRRADAVRNALAQRGIPADRVETRGFGEAYAVASNDTSGGRQLNRRVEIVFSDAQGTFKESRH